jgi:Protein of unknown function (DUF2905)
MLDDVGRTLIAIGLAITGLGMLALLVGRILWSGRLPGDISVGHGPIHVYVPLVTTVALGLALTLVLTLLSWRR